MKLNAGIAIVLALASGGVPLAANHSKAATFTAWEVANVPWGDTLNVRKYPSNASQKQAAYPNGMVLQMTGRCTQGIDILDVEHLPRWKREKLVRYRWCEIWHDPAQNGNFVTGWVYGKYISPY